MAPHDPRRRRPVRRTSPALLLCFSCTSFVAAVGLWILGWGLEKLSASWKNSWFTLIVNWAGGRWIASAFACIVGFGYLEQAVSEFLRLRRERNRPENDDDDEVEGKPAESAFDLLFHEQEVPQRSDGGSSTVSTSQADEAALPETAPPRPERPGDQAAT